MFHELRLKLTLINAAIIFILFFILVTGTYLFSERELTHRSEMLAESLLMKIRADEFSDLPPPPNDFPGPKFFFVKTFNNEVITKSSNISLPTDNLAMLVAQALNRTNSRGTINFNDTEYHFFKSPLNNTGTIILFQDFANESNMLRIQLTSLIVTGLICLALSLYGSFYMANRATGPIQNSWQQQIDFLSDASHELRTPLAVIQTNLEVVMASPAEPVCSQGQWLQNIQEETSQMTKLVDSLLFLARSDSNQLPLANEPFSLNTIIKQATSPFEPVAAAKKLTLCVAAEAVVTVIGDATRIKQVITIIIDNAIHYTPADGVICVNLAKLKNKCIVTVADSGIGIDPAVIDKIFDRFYQVDRSRSNRGAGLGLAIAKAIIEKHGGHIMVASALGRGTTFTIELPT
jgi:signal transduction histidine kinase